MNFLTLLLIIAIILLMIIAIIVFLLVKDFNEIDENAYNTYKNNIEPELATYNALVAKL